MCQENLVIEVGHWVDKSKKIFTRNIFISDELLSNFIAKCNNTGVFRTVYSYTSNDQNNSDLYGDMYFDFDDKDDYSKVREDALSTISYLKIVFKIDPGDLNIFYSGNKGLHITLDKEILGVKPHKFLNYAFKHIAETAHKYSEFKTLDLQIYDNKRLFRIPNSRHEATGLYKRLITFEQLKTLNENEIKELAKEPVKIEHKIIVDNMYARKRFDDIVLNYAKSIEFKNLKSTGNLKYTPPCISAILSEGANKNGRNNTIAVLSSFYKSKGSDMDSAVKEIIEWNSSKNSPPTSEFELKRTVRSIYSGRASYGCTYIESLGFCEKSKCKFKRRKGK